LCVQAGIHQCEDAGKSRLSLRVSDLPGGNIVYNDWIKNFSEVNKMYETVANIGWAMAFALIGGIIGFLMIGAAATFLPHILNKLTPNIDEEREIAMGNRAVAEYFGKIAHAAILGVSILVTAVVVAGLFIAFY